MASSLQAERADWGAETDRPALVADVAVLDRVSWNRIAENCVSARHELVQAMDDDRSVRYRYYLRTEEGRYTCIARLTTGSAYGRSLTRLLFGRTATLLGGCGLSLDNPVVCAWPLGRGRNVLVDPGVPEASRRELLHAACADIEAVAGDNTLVFPDVLDHDEVLASVLEARGYWCATGLPMSRLDLEWEDLDGYLAALRCSSGSWAAGARLEINRYKRSGGVVERLPADADEWERVCALFNDHHVRLNGTSPGHSPEKFRRLRRALGEDLLVYVSRQAGEITGAAGGVRFGTESVLTWIGIDHEAAGRNFTYFNLAYYGSMNDLCEIGVRRIWLGNAAYEAKLRRGCRVSATRTYLRLPGALKRLAIPPLLRLQRAWYARKFDRYLNVSS